MKQKVCIFLVIAFLAIALYHVINDNLEGTLLALLGSNGMLFLLYDLKHENKD